VEECCRIIAEEIEKKELIFHAYMKPRRKVSQKIEIKSIKGNNKSIFYLYRSSE